MDFKAFIIDPKDAKRILFGSSGKLSPIEFAQGLVALVAVSAAMQIIGMVFSSLGPLALLWSLVSIVVAVVLIYAWICVFSKRFHDAGQSGWMTVAAILAAIIVQWVINAVVPGGVTLTSMSDFSALSQMSAPGAVLRGILINVLVNGALGFYMYRLKPAEAEG